MTNLQRYYNASAMLRGAVLTQEQREHFQREKRKAMSDAFFGDGK